MCGLQRCLFSSLGLSYRVLAMCPEDLGDPAYRSPSAWKSFLQPFTLQEIRHRGLDALQAGGLLGRDILILQLYRLSGDHEYVMEKQCW